MGWFDNDKQQPESTRPTRPAPADAPAQKRTASEPAPDGSTFGNKIKIDGTVVSEEPVRILGQVEGKIRAHGELTVAKGAIVRALIQGRRVLVEGSVEGDIQASESVILGASAELNGNITTPQLEIREGALFRGQVEMRKKEAAPESRSAAAGSRRESEGEKSSSGSPSERSGDPPDSEKPEAGSEKEASGTTEEKSGSKGAVKPASVGAGGSSGKDS